MHAGVHICNSSKHWLVQSLANTFGGLLRSDAVMTRTKRMLRRVPAFKYCDMGVYPFSQMWFGVESIWLPNIEEPTNAIKISIT